jgi:hypothetical protein
MLLDDPSPPLDLTQPGAVDLGDICTGMGNVRVPAAWMEINTEGSPPNVIPSFLKIDASVCANNLQFLSWVKAKMSTSNC